MNHGSKIGTYRIDGLIGRGGMAEVYKAWHTGLHRYEALKVLPPQMTFDRSFVDRFLHEARTAAGLRHAHIATIHAVSDHGAPQPYFAMELIEGCDLAALLRERGRLSPAEALLILRQIAEALDYAHSRGVIHRDIKPANILLQTDGHGGWNVKVVDFGIARAQEAGDGARLTKTGIIVGTPEYMSPEQGGSGDTLDARTDLYSLGIIAYEMLCGQPPFRLRTGLSPISVIMAHIREIPAPPIQQIPGLPTPANDAILKALAKRPSDRWNNCIAFVDACSEGPTAGASRVSHTRSFTPAILVAVFVLGVILIALGMKRQQGMALPDPLRTPSQSSPVIVTAQAVPAPPVSTSVASPIVESAPTPPSPSQEWQTWRGNGFQLDYPTGWTVTQKATPDGTRIQFNAPEPDVLFLVDTSIASSFLSPLEGWQDMDQRFRRAHGSNYHLLSLEPGDVDGFPAATWTFTLVRNAQTPVMKRVDLATTQGMRGYALLLSAPLDRFDASGEIFAHVRESFHLTTP